MLSAQRNTIPQKKIPAHRLRDLACKWCMQDPARDAKATDTTGMIAITIGSGATGSHHNIKCTRISGLQN